MFGRVTRQSIQHFGSKVKSHLQTAYRTAKNAALSVDAGVRYAGEIYSAFKPIIADYAPTAEKALSRTVRNVKQDYDTIRDRVVAEDTRASAAIGHVRRKLPEFNL